MVRDLNPGVIETFRTPLDRPRVSPNLLYNANRVSFLEVKWPRDGVDHPPSSRATEEYGQGFVSVLVLKLLLLNKNKIAALSSLCCIILLVPVETHLTSTLSLAAQIRS